MTATKSPGAATIEAPSTKSAEPKAEATAQVEAKPEPAADGKIPTSRVPSSVCRDLWLFSPNRWSGPRPAKVVRGPFNLPDEIRSGADHRADVNVSVHGVEDRDVLAELRHRSEGNTFLAVPVYDALTREQQKQLERSGIGTWAEWPPKV